MNFLPFTAGLQTGVSEVSVEGVSVGIPALREEISERPLLYGVRPEHVRFADNSGLRAEVLGTEYLGTSQIVSLSTANGALLRAKVPASTRTQRGDHVGLQFEHSVVSLFDQASGRALHTALHDEKMNQGVVHG